MTKKKVNTAPESTRAIDYGQDLPRPSGSGPFAKRDPLPDRLVVLLHMEAGPKAPDVFKINKSVVTLGRGDRLSDVDVGDKSASRRHASITYREGRFELKDMGSTNGTVLNGELVGEAELSSGDEIQIGTAVMRFEVR